MDPFTAHRLLSRVPSIRSTSVPKPKPQPWNLSVQRREASGRWREIASWLTTTSETDMQGPLNCGLRENYRIVITPAAEAAQPKESTLARDLNPRQPTDPAPGFNANGQ